MKKLIFTGIITALIFALSGCDDLKWFNNEHNPENVSSISGAKNKRDGTYVRISGVIEGPVSESPQNEWYIFSDNRGDTIFIEIETETWIRNGIILSTLSFPAWFQITGEIDKERGQGTIIEVDRLKKL